MKHIVFTVLMLVSSVFGAEINWAKDFDTGIKEASAKNKPVLFVFSRHSCHYCRVLDETTFEDKKVIKALNRDFVSIISYTDEKDYTPRKLWRPGTPTLWFLDPEGEPLFKPLAGAIDAENFLKALAIVKKEFDQTLGK
ncbi:MAG: thioredoxin family protein [Sulfurimonas sp.]|nr:thioredoxin family protein [Sulfurimonas sp.]MDQ7062428.1 thioredoxin family protein [Sulfurimonas sp.]